jgi:hypothetical protein
MKTDRLLRGLWRLTTVLGPIGQARPGDRHLLEKQTRLRVPHPKLLRYFNVFNRRSGRGAPLDWLAERLRTTIGLVQHPVANAAGIMLTLPGKIDDSNRDSLFGRVVTV